MKVSKKTRLEDKVNEMIEKYKKVMVTSDYHIPYQNNDAVEITKRFAKDYKPDVFVINGDFLDLYRVSKFDKDPERKYTVADEISKGRRLLKALRKTLGSKTEMYFLEGNHENRMQKFLWRNPELDGLSDLKVENLLRLKDYGIKYIGVDHDYWSTLTGHLKTGDTLIMHGDARLNGASLSKYAGYSVKNTMLGGVQQNVIIGHNHRLAQIHHRTPYALLKGAEGGCLCKLPGNVNWQNGFVTYELIGDKMVNLRTHLIEDNKLYNNDWVYESVNLEKTRRAKRKKR